MEGKTANYTTVHVFFFFKPYEQIKEHSLYDHLSRCLKNTLSICHKVKVKPIVIMGEELLLTEKKKHLKHLPPIIFNDETLKAFL